MSQELFRTASCRLPCPFRSPSHREARRRTALPRWSWQMPAAGCCGHGSHLSAIPRQSNVSFCQRFNLFRIKGAVAVHNIDCVGPAFTHGFQRPAYLLIRIIGNRHNIYRCFIAALFAGCLPISIASPICSA